MKKLIPLMLVLALLLCACGDSNVPSGTITTTEPAATEPAATEPVATEPPATEPPATEPAKIMTLGRIEGGTYTNDYWGFAMDLDSTWVYSSAEELQELPEDVSGMLNDSELSESLLANIYDMQAESAEALANINVLYQKMDLATRLTYASMTDDQILDALLAQMDTMVEAYTQMGLTNVAITKTTATFLGAEVPALMTTYMMQDVPAYCLQIFNFHLGQYSCTITFTSFLEDRTADLAAMCYAIGE